MNEKILVVDDEKSIVDILKFNLQKEGYQVFTGADGQEALDLYEACHPDLILLDVMMPRLSGYDVRRKIRERRHGAHHHADGTYRRSRHGAGIGTGR